MKTIVVSGARSNVGKTSLARSLCRLLPGAVHVKLGHGREKPGAGNVFYAAGTPFERIVAAHGRAPFLVIESNRILEEIDPDLAVYLPADDPKPSARTARARADIVRGEDLAADLVDEVARRLDVPVGTAAEIVRIVSNARDDRERNENGQT